MGDLVPKIRPKKTNPREVFLDSGAYSLYYANVQDRQLHTEVAFFKSKEFWDYVDEYARFVIKYGHLFDYYANCDAIYDPKISWKVLKYLENEYGLNPVPVIHYGTDIKWFEKHIDAGYDLIGIGGAGSAGQLAYVQWANKVFDCVCSTSNRMPRVRTHGFAMTTYKLLMKYPWWSVDSTSWAKWAGFGIIYVPHRKGGEFSFDENPYPIFISQESPRVEIAGRHVETLSLGEKKTIKDWLKYINVPYGSSKEWGVSSENSARIIANLRFFEKAIESLPDYPWAFRMPEIVNRGFVRR